MGVGELGGSYMIDPLGDGWQRNLSVNSLNARQVPAVYASVMLISRSLSQCPAEPRSKNSDGVVTVLRNHAAYRVLKKPNSYQSGQDLLFNAMAMALFEGEAFIMAVRNDRSEISELHLMPHGSCTPHVDPNSKAIYYAVGSNPMTAGGTDYMAPARDILHLKFHTPRHPLIGESPIKAAALAVGVNVALSRTQKAFFDRMARPSGVIETADQLSSAQIEQLRSSFGDQSRGYAAGGIPILGQGITFKPLSVSSQDKEVIQAQRMSLEDIARVFGTPPSLIGDMSQSTYSNSESAIQMFLSQSLGFYIEAVERSLERLFDMGYDQSIKLDERALLRTDYAARVQGLATLVTSGILTPNEARAYEGHSPIAGGDAAFMQRQMTAIDLLEQLNAADLQQGNAPKPSGASAKAAIQAILKEAK